MTNQTLPPSAPQPYGPPPEPPKRSFRQRRPKTFWFLIILAILVGIIIVSAIASPSKNDSGSVSVQPSTGSTASSKAATKPTGSAKKSAPATSTPAAKKGPGVGDEVRDGKFAFTVTKVKCGVKKIGHDILNAKAQGQFCLVSLTVKNIGDEPQTMFSSDQKGFIGDTEYAVDDTATIYAAGNGDSAWLKEINPGNTLTGPIVFDIPKGAKLDRLELHDSAFSDGAPVFP